MRIPRRPLAEEAYRRLLSGVMSGRFPPGQRMKEESLCRTLGVSRTPLREAMIRLTREGVLERKANCGCAVRSRRSDELKELFEGRRLLECLALREWFSNLDIPAFKEMKSRLLKAKTSGATTFRDEILRADETLHEAIASACPNGFIASHIRHLQMLCRPYRAHRCFAAEDLKAIFAERMRVINAILSGDIEAAEAGLSAHFECSLRHYRQESAKHGKRSLS